MKETGIIMSGNHPNLILDGIKTMTRRVIKPQPTTYSGHWWDCGKKIGTINNIDFPTVMPLYCPYGQVGDRLRVRESWATENQYNHLKPSEIPSTAIIYYLASTDYDPFKMGIKRPSIFMPRWASRIDLEITGIKVERLQEITEENALAEGIKVMQGTWQTFERSDTDKLKLIDEPQPYTARYHFEALWDSLNAKRGYSWESNPWVWVIGFKEMSILGFTLKWVQKGLDKKKKLC